jgi:hypothetical protein
VIDDQDRLVKLGDGFYRFAEEHGWAAAGDSLGRSLWDFVAGAEVRKLQRLLVRRIREEARAVELPFRCDGPDARLEMTMRIAASRSRSTVAFASRIERERPRERQPLLDRDVPRDTDETLEMCAWCDRFAVERDWLEIEEAAARLGLFRRAKLPGVSHGICPSCSGRLMAA